MAYGPSTPLPVLTPEELATVRGSGGALDFSFTTPPFRGQVGLTHTGPRGSVGGTLSTDGRTWVGGFQTTLTPSPKVNLGGFARTDGREWEAGVTGRIRFLTA